jgi:hypothetical protein
LATAGFSFWLANQAATFFMSSSDSGAAMPPMMALLRAAGLPSTALKLLSCL